jgi:DNA-binding NtrC family response regulator
MRYLLTWLGSTDVRAAGIELDEAGLEKRVSPERPMPGPLAQVLAASHYDCVTILVDRPKLRRFAPQILAWLGSRVGELPDIRFKDVDLKGSAVEFRQVYEASVQACDEVRAACPGARLTFLFSAGTPAMRAIWVILAKSRYQAEIVESSPKYGVHTVDVPLRIGADLLTRAAQDGAKALAALAGDDPGAAGRADFIVHGSPEMNRVLDLARRFAATDYSVLIRGERGTGKESLAKEIHESSMRKGKPYITVNCAALSPERGESELFGHEKGAFTGAVAKKVGLIQEADAGTIFFDEIGELPLETQAKLLRFLQDQELRPVGSTKSKKANVRLVAATNRDLRQAVREGDFRADLLDRLQVELEMPPLRERGDGVTVLINAVLEQVNKELKRSKVFAPEAVERLRVEPWPGNIRQVIKLVRSIAVRFDGDQISRAQVEEVLRLQGPLVEDPRASMPEARSASPRLGASGFKLRDAVADYELDLIEDARSRAGKNFADAGRLLGEPDRNYVRRRYKALSAQRGRRAGMPAK